MITEKQYVDRDNIIDLLLKADDVAQDLSSLTKINLVVGSTTISNSVAASFPIKWSTGTTGKIQMKLGDQGLSVGIYTAKIIIYDATYPNGLVWDTFTLNVMA